MIMLHVFIDSPGVPPSATAHELFRGFSYVAPMLHDGEAVSQPAPRANVAPTTGPDSNGTSALASVSNTNILHHLWASTAVLQC